MLPLIGLAATFVPELIRLIAGDKAGTVANTVAQAVTDLAGSNDPVAARQKLAADPVAAAALQQRLAEIALDATKAQLAETAQQRQDELDAIKLNDANTAGARDTMQSLASAASPLAWGAPLVSIMVTGGFFAVLALIILNGLRAGDEKTADIINIAVGVLGTGFATVVNFWLGSSSSSRNKDAHVLALQADHRAQSSDLLRTLQKAHDTHAENTRSAFAAVEHVVSKAVDGSGAVHAASETAPPATKIAGFDRCVEVTLAQEGGFTQLPNDPGGATNFGITLATLQGWQGSPTGVDDIRNLTRQEAVEIYRANYWLPARCDDLPSGIDMMVFDCGVNSGVRTSVRMLQRVVGVTEDGSLGPKTLAAVQGASDPRSLINQLASSRLSYCRTLPTYQDFGAGWANRVQQVTAAALAMA
jgi:murein L,D-transpeptidase YcbB/YkuD